MSDDVQAYTAPEKAMQTAEDIWQDAYNKGWKQGVIAMESWTLEQGLDRRDVHSIAVQIMHNPLTEEDRRAARFAELVPAPREPLNAVVDLANKPDNGDDRDIFGQAIEDKLAEDQHAEYNKENN